MISALEAHRIILSANLPSHLLKSEGIEIEKSNGHFLADDILASRDQPPFNRSMMDGIAICSSAQKRIFKKESIARAGFPKINLLSSGNCIEVMTGAPVPEGCDCVIPYEEVTEEEGLFKIRSQDYQFKKNQFIHSRGVDYKDGDILLKSRSRINSTTISLLCSVGHTHVNVLKFGPIAIVSTGDELIDMGLEVEDHQIYKSNPHAIRSEILNFFPDSEINQFHLNDDETEVEGGLLQILSTHQLVIISGGVSKGKFDFIPNALKKIGTKELFHKVKQRPGKPLWFGLGDKGQLVFGLPGNPVSSLVNTRRHIIPLMVSYLCKEHKFSYSVQAAKDMEIGSDFTHFIPVSIEVERGVISASPSVGNNSGDFSKLVLSRGFIEVPANDRRIVKGKSYEFFPWGGLD